ncbi:hypothetical protein [Bartonella henselae]|uniref:Uncharacterized protein n=1 Tax=Bartonella henselae TaxID=38323 RepID=X5MI99_BARHN|nr:hypothetical protein [Bartonella henselae]KEC60350.1 hypothetical protein O97_00046 [Bartonella henselae str. Zeus]KEC60370.1 hypothetical protein O95_00418 [Bartonella henselae JK 53]MDM9996917.1 hypothetical protein [Bartonella henselae]OLL49999.1 hypothetical protein AT247_07075 [Bartonella henselae]OLL51091.1 hypothetical protein AT241_06240 [Bartonella henselae]
MKRIVLTAALFSIFSSVLSPVTANALPVGNSWGTKSNAIVEQLVTKNNFGDREKKILQKIIVPERKNLFTYDNNKFQVQKKYHTILMALGLRNGCRDLDPKEYSGQKWMSCSIN